jgi:hypothetical protein
MTRFYAIECLLGRLASYNSILLQTKLLKVFPLRTRTRSFDEIMAVLVACYVSKVDHSVRLLLAILPG